MTRTRIGICLSCLLMTAFTACKNSNSPEAVSEKFLISFAQLDFETAKSLSTRNTWEILNLMADFTEDYPEEITRSVAANMKIKILGTDKETDSTLIITFQTDPKFLPFQKFRLLKREDNFGKTRWKVDISTIDLVGDEPLYIDQALPPIQEVERNLPDSATGERK